jgi:NADH-quinone oxidoreductase subunit F
LEAYKALGGVQGLEQALRAGPQTVLEEIKRSGLTGRGGAGFPEGLKWQAAAGEKKYPKYFICNADEGELGTFKDKVLLDGDPWAVLEGILIAAYAIRAQHAYIYIKGEYEATYELWETLARQAERAGLLGERILGSEFSVSFHVAKGRGPYIAGEEFALIASLEARRPMSRLKPPYPTDQGLFGRPTVVNNVETIANVPVILAQGASKYRKLGTKEEPGTRLFSLSGDVKKPGVYELEIGSGTLRELIDEFGKGTTHGRPVKAVQPGGGTSALLPEDALDCPLTAEAIRKAGSGLGTAGVIVYEEGKSAVDIARGLLEFYGVESCGRCSPCRIGVVKMKEIIEQISRREGTAEDLARLRHIGRACVAASTCGMGQAFPLPVLSALELFPEDFNAGLRRTSAKQFDSRVVR